MKKVFKYCLLLAWMAIAAGVHGQNVEPDMYATTTNNKLAVIVKNNTTFNQYFVVENNDSVHVSLYFKDDDVRNGQYSAKVKPLGTGQIGMIFDALDFQQNDALTFHATESINGTIRGYTFINGAYVGESATDVTDCPVRISCGTNGYMAIHFPPNILVGPTLGVFVNVTFFFQTWKQMGLLYSMGIISLIISLVPEPGCLRQIVTSSTPVLLQ